VLARNSNHARSHAIAKAGDLSRAREARSNDSDTNRFSVSPLHYLFLAGVQGLTDLMTAA